MSPKPLLPRERGRRVVRDGAREAPRADAEAAVETAEAVARRSYGRLVALLARRTRDVAGAEDALSEAFATALVQWPERGTPDNPEAWLLTVARRRLIDASRRRRTASEASDLLRHWSETLEAARLEADGVPDERIGLMFACAHPAIAPNVRAPLILQTLFGFDAATIGSAFLVSPASMGQRLVRAKKKIREAGIPFEVPQGEALAERLDAVLEAIYTTYSEGWLDPLGHDAGRRNRAVDAIGLARLVVATLPDESEAIGLLALLLYAQSRQGARRDEQGEFVPLSRQDPTSWDASQIDEAESWLRRASALPGSGRFQLEAAVQSVHSARRRTGRIDWPAIEAIYEALWVRSGSPVVAVNRAVAMAEVRGAAVGLGALDASVDPERVADYQPYWAARADLLARSDRRAEAESAYCRAIGLETDPAVRRFLEGRRAALGD